MSATAQLEMPLRPDWRTCAHESGFHTLAYVPGGFFCCECETLVCQDIPQSPERLGYVSATWAWHHQHGRPWTTQEAK